MNPRFRFQWLVVPVILLGTAALCVAAEVTAELQRDTVTTDEMVILDVTVRGGHPDESPEPPQIPGLQYLGTSSSRRIEMRNLHDVSQTVTFSFQYAPRQTGSIAIPAIDLRVDGKLARTRELTLHVEAGSGGSRHSGSSWQGRSRRPASPSHSTAPGSPGAAAPSQQDEEPSRMAFAEWVLPKKTGYVGEAIPAELRLYVANRLKWNLTQYPTITGDGFMMQKLPEKPASSIVTRDGQQWDMVVFKTAITPVKSGTVEVSPSEFLPIVVVPQNLRLRPPPGFDDFFNDSFFNDAFGVAARKQLSVKTEPLELEVKPLPKEGQPASFSGAVGRFTLGVSAGPLRVKGGDPVTLTMKIGGSGNFERVAAPHVEEQEGWQIYPPSSTFTADDTIGISGEKTFEMAVIPEGTGGIEKLLVPEVEFSYFDPVKEAYVTLHGERKEIVVSGGSPSAPPVSPSKVVQQPTPEHQPQAADDIRFIRLDPGAWSVARGPLWRSPLFLGIQGAALLAFLGVCTLGWYRHRPAPAREARWREQRAAALKRARQATSAPDFYDAAVEALTLHVALKEGRPDPSPAEVMAALPGASAVAEIFATRDRLRYAGNAVATEEGRLGVLQQELANILKS